MDDTTARQNTDVTLGEHFADFVDTQVASGRFSSASEVVRAGLRLLEEREAEMAALRRAIHEGDTSELAAPYDRTTWLAARRSERKR